MEDVRAKALLNEVSRQSQRILGEKLRGLYVHGSMAFGCFHWARSDLDLLAVVDEKLETGEKLALLAALDSLRHKAPPKGFEISVVLTEVCAHPNHPAPYELHFSKAAVMRAPVYVILNLCRTQAFLREGQVLSKEDGGRWALEHLDRRWRGLISAALEGYTEGTAVELPSVAARAFCRCYCQF